MLRPGDIDELLSEHGLAPSKRLGQNFVADPNTIRKIVALAEVGPTDRVIEVGPGLGSLSLALADTGCELVMVERDRGLADVMRSQTASYDNARLIEADAMQLNWDEVAVGDAWKVVANLPYNISIPLVLDLLQRVPAIERMMVMVQREAGERLAAGPGSRTYGVPSIQRAMFADATVAASVSAEVFIPKPRVSSVLLDVRRHDHAPEPARHRLVSELVSAAFVQRRKMLRSSLGRRVPSGAFEAAGIDETDRPEQIDVERWLALAEAVEFAGGAVGDG